MSIPRFSDDLSPRLYISSAFFPLFTSVNITHSIISTSRPLKCCHSPHDHIPTRDCSSLPSFHDIGTRTEVLMFLRLYVGFPMFVFSFTIAFVSFGSNDQLCLHARCSRDRSCSNASLGGFCGLLYDRGRSKKEVKLIKQFVLRGYEQTKCTTFDDFTFRLIGFVAFAMSTWPRSCLFRHHVGT